MLEMCVPYWVVHYKVKMDGAFGVGTFNVLFYCTVYANSETRWTKINMSGSSDSEEFYDAEDLTPNRSSRWKIHVTSVPVYNIEISLKRTLDIIFTGRTGSDTKFFINMMYYINNCNIELWGCVI